MGKCLCFHFEIDLGINVRRVKTDVPEPRPDGIDIDPRAKQMNRACMSDAMGTDPLGGK